MDAATQLAIRQIGEQVKHLSQQVQVLQRGARTTQLAGATVDGGTLSFTDGDGNISHVIGLQPDGTVAAVSQSPVPPPVEPSTPLVSPIASGLLVTWDGTTSDGSNWLADFTGVQVHVSTSSGFTPTTSTLQGLITVPGAFVVGNLSFSNTYYVVLVAMNSSGLLSIPSAQVAGTPSGAIIAPGTVIQASLAAGLGLGGNLCTNSYFAGGDTTGWSPFNGTLTTTQTPPGTVPFGAGGWAAQFVSTNNSNALEGSPAAFAATTNTQYMITGWVNAPSGTNNIQIGFDWRLSGAYVSTTTVAFNGTGDWKQFTTTITSPSSGINQAYPRIGGNVSAETLYIWGVVVMPQIPGGLLQVGSITATQIAAQTITAALIAANTITAAQIAAGTITATQIAAGTVVAGIINGTTITGATFQGTNWIENSAGEFLYNGTPATGNLRVSIAPTSGTDSFSNSFPAGLKIFGTNTGASVTLDPTANSGEVFLVMSPGNATKITTPPQLFAAVVNAAAANESESLVAYSGQSRTGITNANAALQLFGACADNSVFSRANFVLDGKNISLKSAIAGNIPVTSAAESPSPTIGGTTFTDVTNTWTIPANDPMTNSAGAGTYTVYRLTNFGTFTSATTTLSALQFQIFGMWGSGTGFNFPIGFGATGQQTGTTYHYRVTAIVFCINTSNAGFYTVLDGCFSIVGNVNGITVGQNSVEDVQLSSWIGHSLPMTTSNASFKIQAAWTGTNGGQSVTPFFEIFERFGA